MRATRHATLGLLLAGAFAACAAGAAPPRTERPPQPGGTAVAGSLQEPLVPVGHGTLKQDAVTLSLRVGGLLVKVTPLSEHVIRLTAPDTYARLHGLAESRRDELDAGSLGTPELFLVSFFSYQQDVAFQPEDLQLVSQGRLLRALGMAPVTSGWGRQLLQQQESQTALYAFEGPIDYDQPFTLRYGTAQTDGWNSIIPKLREERNRVQSRVGSSPGE